MFNRNTHLRVKTWPKNIEGTDMKDEKMDPNGSREHAY